MTDKNQISWTTEKRKIAESRKVGTKKKKAKKQTPTKYRELNPRQLVAIELLSLLQQNKAEEAEAYFLDNLTFKK